MTWIRRSPFNRNEDAADFMIDIVARESIREGAPLTDEEKKLLRNEWTRINFSRELEARVYGLVGRVIERERIAAEQNQPRSFCGAIEWAGDQEYPVIVELAERYYRETIPRRRLRGSDRLKDRLFLVGWAVLIVLTMLAIASMLGLFGVPK